jgi:GT2 family glycosyltransferase
MEDVAFCDMIKDKGFKIWVDPKMIIGHEKMMVLI